MRRDEIETDISGFDEGAARRRAFSDLTPYIHFRREGHRFAVLTPYAPGRPRSGRRLDHFPERPIGLTIDINIFESYQIMRGVMGCTRDF